MTTATVARPERVHPDASAAPRVRIEPVDLLRGIIMILMALDHTRDFFGDAAANPTDMATTTAALFLTRWVTHFCAPVFFFLTGTGASLASGRRSTSNLSRFLLTRGLWLVFLELVVMRTFWQFNVDYRVTIITVLWALGWSMVALAAFVWLPRWLTATIGGAMVLLHNLADGVAPATFGSLAPLWNVLHVPGVLSASPEHFVLLAYPLIPWIGVMALGYAFGAIYGWAPDRRRAFLLRLGLGMIAAFVVLRLANVYGDASHWAPQRTAGLTVLSFMNASKYPPSLLFLLMTLGPAMLALRALDAGTPRALRPALVIGRVPMFYYILHVLVLHLVALVLCYARFGAVHWMFESNTPAQFPVTQPPGWPLPLPAVYLIWLTVVLVLYPCCRWYGALKARSGNPLLSYI